jgi:hypothetical protein
VAAKPVAAQPATGTVASAPSTGASTVMPAPAAPKPAAPSAPTGAPAAAATDAPLRVSDLISEPEGSDAAGANGDHAAGAGSGLGSQEQIRQRDEQSRRDASVQADARRQAATRALGALSALPGPEAVAAPPSPDRTAVRPPPPATIAPPAPVSVPPPPAHLARPAAGNSGAPLLEVKPSQMFTDTQHLGERLAIFNDRIELRDRADRVRQMIPAAEITNVVVHKRFTGSTVTVECRDAEPIVAKGLKPDQADEIRALILKRTREGAAPPSLAEPATPAPPPHASGAAPGEPTSADQARPETSSDQVDLVAKLAALRDAGILTDAEYRDKVALVSRLASGASLASTSSST